MKIDRRDFLRGTVAAAGSLLALSVAARPARASAAQGTNTRPDGFAMLSDLTKCAGCRRCEAACNKANGLPPPETSFEDPSVFNEKRRTEPYAYTVVNKYENPRLGKTVFRKLQCNHCAEPACASACLVGALKKTPEGPVIYREELCLGCRYCMTACPFNIPTFEYHDALSPAIRKCTMCYHRISSGKIPACAEACATGALMFGKRSELLGVAADRIRNGPKTYVNHIYGEHEVGGTDWLYISGVPFEEVGLPTNLGVTPFPELTRDFLSAVPFVLVVWPALLGGFYALTKRRQQMAEAEAPKREKEAVRQ